MATPDSAAAAEATLIRRVLFAASPNVPTPILLRSAGPLDHEAALLLAHGLRAAVLPWYSRLTPDRELLTVITQVVAALLERIGQRLGSTEGQAALARFVGDELPALLRTHIEDVRSCEAVAGTAAGQHASLATLYLARAPHPALRVQPGTGEPLVDGAYLRALVEALLEALLPEEHWASECERFIVRDVVVGILRGSVLGRCARPWFLVETAHKLLDARASTADEVAGTSKTAAAGSSVISVLQKLVSLALLCLSMLLPPLLRAYVELFTPAEMQHRRRARRRRSNIDAHTPGGPAWIVETDEPSVAPPPTTRLPRRAPLLRVASLLSVTSVMFELGDRALSRAALLLLRLAGDLGLAGLVEARIDLAVRQAVEPERLAPVVRAVREAALPGGQLPPPAPPDPTPAQRRQDFARLLPRLCAAMPGPLRALLLGVQPATQAAALARAIAPFMGPPPAPHSPEHHSGLAELANVRLYLAILERLAVLIDPALEEAGLTAVA